MNIGIDIDGVLFPWADAANTAVMSEFGVADPGPHVTWEHLKHRLDRDQWAWLWSDEGADAVFGQTWQTYPDAVPAVNAILKAGHRVHFVTHRDPRRTASHTAAFLRRHFGGHPWAGLHVVQNSVAKRTIARWDVFVDDKPETVWDFLANTGAMTFCPARPWNEDGLGDISGSTFCRYTDARQVAEWVLERS